MLLAFIKWIVYLIQPKAGIADITIVRRYPDATGCTIGEIYIDGRMLGNSCDRFSTEGELFKQPIKRSISSIKNSVYTICSGDFIAGCPTDSCYVDCFNDLCSKLDGIKDIRLTVLNRLLIER